MGGSSSKGSQVQKPQEPTIDIILKSLGTLKIKEGELIKSQKEIQSSILKHKKHSQNVLLKMTNANSMMNNKIDKVTIQSTQLNLKIKAMKQQAKNNLQKEVQSKTLGRTIA